MTEEYKSPEFFKTMQEESPPIQDSFPEKAYSEKELISPRMHSESGHEQPNKRQTRTAAQKSRPEGRYAQLNEVIQKYSDLREVTVS